jgi:quinoprotein glucose dehydrogenase
VQAVEEAEQLGPLALGGLEVAGASDWPNYNRDLAGSRFSPLTQINTANVAELVVAWTRSLGPLQAEQSAAIGLTPIVVDGRLFVVGRGHVAALDPTTGAEIWRFELPDEARIPRGLTHWSAIEGGVARIFVTLDKRMLALDAQTGQLTVEFGTQGEIELAAAYTSAATRFDDLLIVGSDGLPGGIRAYDAETGSEVWAFDARPAPGSAAAGSWQAGTLQAHPGIPHPAWSFTIDVDRELLFAVFGSPGPGEYYGGHRPGDTLFANSVVALDIRTGDYRWHFQTVHHDIWGRRCSCASSSRASSRPRPTTTSTRSAAPP